MIRLVEVGRDDLDLVLAVDLEHGTHDCGEVVRGIGALEEIRIHVGSADRPILFDLVALDELVAHGKPWTDTRTDVLELVPEILDDGRRHEAPRGHEDIQGRARAVILCALVAVDLAVGAAIVADPSSEAGLPLEMNVTGNVDLSGVAIARGKVDTDLARSVAGFLLAALRNPDEFASLELDDLAATRTYANRALAHLGSAHDVAVVEPEDVRLGQVDGDDFVLIEIEVVELGAIEVDLSISHALEVAVERFAGLEHDPIHFVARFRG